MRNDKLIKKIIFDRVLSRSAGLIDFPLTNITFYENVFLPFYNRDNLTRDFINKLKKNESKNTLLLSTAHSEYSWITGINLMLDYEKSYNFIRITDFINRNFNVVNVENKLFYTTNWIDKEKYFLFRDNSPTNNNPDFIFWNIKNGHKIGVEVTVLDEIMPTTQHFIDKRGVDRENEKYTLNETKKMYNWLTKNIKELTKPLNLSTLAENTIDKKSKKIDSWENGISEKILVIVVPLKILKNNVYKNLENILMVAVERNIKKSHKFHKIVVSVVGETYSQSLYQGFNTYQYLKNIMK